eukprot:1789850-Karenia_brevis.AAC.1
MTEGGRWGTPPNAGEMIWWTTLGNVSKSRIRRCGSASRKTERNGNDWNTTLQQIPCDIMFEIWVARPRASSKRTLTCRRLWATRNGVAPW